MTDTLDGWAPADTLEPRPPVSALAIVALALSVLWVYGLGSLMGIVLGGVALGRIRWSGGHLRGRAVARIAIGWGVLAVAATVAGLAWMVTHFTFDVDFGKLFQPTTLALGRTGTYRDATDGAPRSVTAYFVSYPLPPATAAPVGDATQYAVVEVGVCTGNQAYTPGDTQSDWSVATDAGTGPSAALWGGTAPMIGATSPGLSVAPHACGRGSIVFSMPVGSTVTSVSFTDINDGALPVYAWSVPPA